MKIKVLAENTTSSVNFTAEHGLSLYIETKKHKILFDTGASGLFAENAKKMGIDLKKVDIVVISHGHYDHGGGLKTFLEINSQAKIYFNHEAFFPHYSNRMNGIKANIGLDVSLLPNEHFVLCNNRFEIDEELELFSNVESKKLIPSGNKDLFIKAGDFFIKDDFRHEQNLVIKEQNKMLLIAGCAHTGIVNIVERFYEEKGFMPQFIIGGFHLYNRGMNQYEDPKVVEEIGKYLLSTKAKIYTCHCTGVEPYKHLKNIIGNSIEYISTGEKFKI